MEACPHENVVDVDAKAVQQGKTACPFKEISNPRDKSIAGATQSRAILLGSAARLLALSGLCLRGRV